MILLLQGGPLPDAGIDFAIAEVFRSVGTFISNDASVAAQVIFGTLLVFHTMVGAAELVTGEQSRLVSASFWVRIVVVGLVTFGFSALVLEFARMLVVNPGQAIVQTYGDAWSSYYDSTWTLMKDSFNAKWSQAEFWDYLFMSISFFLDLLFSVVGFIVGALVSLLLMLYCYFQLLVGIGMSGLVLAVGPICLPFGAHEATQDIAIGYLKSFLVYVVCYMPLLLLGFEIAMKVLLSPAMFAAGARYMQGDGVTEQFVGVVICPLSAVAIVHSVPSFIKGFLK